MMISFINLPFLLVMGIPLLVFGYLILTDKDRFLEMFEPKVLVRLSVANEALPLRGRNLILLLALLLMIVAMARPVIDHGDKRIQIAGLHAVVALDISASMRATDLYPNRLAFAKKKMIQLFGQMPYDDLSIIAFAHVSFILAPFSSDKLILTQIVEGITPEYINMSSTDFRAMGSFASTLLKDKKEKILILFSDGDEPESLKAFAKILQENHISLYVVLLGTKAGSPVLDQAGKPLIYQGKIPITQRNDYLGDIALEQGGSYVVAKTGEGDIIKLVKAIKSHHKSQQQGEIVIHNREELFFYPLGLGVLFLLLGFSSIPSRESIGQRVRGGLNAIWDSLDWRR